MQYRKRVLKWLMHLGLSILTGCTSFRDISLNTFLKPTVLEIKEDKKLLISSFFLQVYLASDDLLAQKKFKTLRIYIEGDGDAWINRYTPAADPTPTHPVGLFLASQDAQMRQSSSLASNSRGIAYLARPCQFLKASNSLCKNRTWWTSSRFGSSMLIIMNEAVNQLKARYGAEEIELVGFSGGAAIALLLGAYRHGAMMKNPALHLKGSFTQLKKPFNDVRRVITVAGCLDHETWTHHHGVTPLYGSLNPLDYLSYLKNISQIHCVGGKDHIVPLYLTQKFINYPEFKKNRPRLITIPAATHTNWSKYWPSIVATLK